MATSKLRWKVYDALSDLDKKQNYLEIAKDYVKEKCREAMLLGGIVLGVSGALGVPIGLLAIVAEQFTGSKVEAYETSRPKTDMYEKKYSGLAERVSKKTCVDERILIGLIAGGNTTYANELRENGYAGIIPLRPEEAGLTAETLKNDDEQCLMSAARVFKDIAGEQNSPNLESAVGIFWYREIQETAEKTSEGNWDYVSSALRAYERRKDYGHAAHFKQVLQEHEGAIAVKKRLEQRFSGKEKEFWVSRSTALQKEIKDPAFMFFCNAVVEAHRRYKAGKEFDWIDLLPVKLAAAVYCSVAYMDGVELKND